LLKTQLTCCVLNRKNFIAKTRSSKILNKSDIGRSIGTTEPTILPRQLRSMTEFIQTHKLPFGIIINQNARIEWITKNIIQVPAGYL